MRTILFGFAAAAMAAFAADAPAPAVGKIIDNQIRLAEREMVPLAEEMPAGKYDFAPTAGEFKTVRTFAQQMSHVAAVNFMVAAAALGEKNPSDIGPNENGPASIKGKEAIVKYLKDSYAYAHKAAAALTADNMLEMMPSPFGSGKSPRLGIITEIVWHTFDHYGQSVVYARMNGIVPPASRR